jgi:hypothetical protein
LKTVIPFLHHCPCPLFKWTLKRRKPPAKVGFGCYIVCYKKGKKTKCLIQRAVTFFNQIRGKNSVRWKTSTEAIVGSLREPLTCLSNCSAQRIQNKMLGNISVVGLNGFSELTRGKPRVDTGRKEKHSRSQGKGFSSSLELLS